ncbi:MAG: sensor histidine kinase, partial [Nitrospiraceae bacterium]|nr:sensor histidine kinase [Nitrospiraceae bacterium]
ANTYGLESGDYLRITVQDQGSGIAEEHLPKLFDPYFTTKGSSSMRGTGLGLAICFTIAKNHGGTITVASRPGEGSVFTILLRATPAGTP